MIIGIDLGTTNCACAVFRNGEIEMVPNSLGHVLTPSAVSIDEDGNILTGLAARERQSTHPDRTITAFKRYMGTNHEVKLGKLRFKPEELSALMLRSLVHDASIYLGEPVQEAVITVPAYFNDKQRKATRRAGALAGIKVERLINEPTAAALAYGLHQRDKQTRFLVFDLGGGTFDVSILEIFEGVIEVRATAGDNRLGGEDFNELLIEMAREKLSIEDNVVRNDNVLYQRMREAAERTRRALSDAPSAVFSFVWREKTYSHMIETEAFETKCEALLKRLRDPVLRSFRDSQSPVESLDEIILVGGATRMPVVRKSVTRMFGRFPSSAINADEAVARGAAVQAALKARSADLAEVVLTDVCPYSLGVETSERHSATQVVVGIFKPILERNCIIPASREEIFGTLEDSQKAVRFPIYQGESRWVKDNVLLGNVLIPVPPAPAGKVEIKCRFSYDINGLLEVDVYVPETGRREQIVLVDRDGVAPDEIEKRRADLAKLKIHPRDTDSMRAALARAGRCFENAVGEERIWIGQLIGRFEDVLAKQEPRSCEAARVELNAALDRIEGQSFL